MIRRTLTVLATAALLVVGGASLAAADTDYDGGGEATPGGGLTVTVSFSGNAAPSGGGPSGGYSVPATCWWEPASLSTAGDGSITDVDTSDPEALEAYYEWVRPYLTGHAAGGSVSLGDWEQWKVGLKRMLENPAVGIYKVNCRDGAPECAMIEYLGGEGATGYYGPGDHTGECGLAMEYAFYTAAEVPEPAVDPEDLAEAARDAMVIPDPVVDRNPKAAGVGGATLVSLPTWFWVTDPRSVGGQDGERSIRATVPSGAWAEVTATTGGLRVTSAAGGVSCSPAEALTVYAAGANEAGACKVEFNRASVGYANGFPVDTATQWAGEWVGSPQAGAATDGGGITVPGRNATVNVPVAESQSLVRSAG